MYLCQICCKAFFHIVTLEGIVSGGVGECTKGIKEETRKNLSLDGITGMPRWFTRVAAYRDWIDCISDGIMKRKNKKAIEKLCNWNFAAQGDQSPPDNLLEFPET